KSQWPVIPSEVVRKLHHIGFSFTIFFLLHLFSAWYAAVAAAFIMLLIFYPTLLVAERVFFFKRNFSDRRQGGELRRQFIYIQLTFVLLIFIFWGVLGPHWRYIAVVAIMTWGFGDAAAALIGTAFGRHPVSHRMIKTSKTYEGT